MNKYKNKLKESFLAFNMNPISSVKSCLLNNFRLGKAVENLHFAHLEMVDIKQLAIYAKIEIDNT